mmetsp:Transcript_60777/g.112764  ORF Transcript_60777/g.112764 Transcript_60777/m.112764 type:complete len:105 (+) Transcript_60777:650-964(+)
MVTFSGSTSSDPEATAVARAVATVPLVSFWKASTRSEALPLVTSKLKLPSTKAVVVCVVLVVFSAGATVVVDEEEEEEEEEAYAPDVIEECDAPVAAMRREMQS